MRDKRRRGTDGSRAGTPPLVIFTRSFRALPGTVRDTLIALRERLHGHISNDLMGRAELVLAELLNNIAQHGRPNRDGPMPLVHLSVVARSDGLSCSVSDNGRLLPTICLNSQPPEPSGYPEGGFGWFLIGHLTQSLAYFREDEQNYVAFTVPLATPDPQIYL